MQTSFSPGRQLFLPPPSAVWRGQSLFGPLADRFGEKIFQAQTQQAFVEVRHEFMIWGQGRTKFPEVMIQEWRTGLDGVSHTHAIYLKVDEVRHSRVGLKVKETVEGMTAVYILAILFSPCLMDRREQRLVE